MRTPQEIRETGAAWITEAELAALLDDLDGYRRAIDAHHDLATFAYDVIREYDGREWKCPVCNRAWRA